jgi:ribosomal protein S24E
MHPSAVLNRRQRAVVLLIMLSCTLCNSQIKLTMVAMMNIVKEAISIGLLIDCRGVLYFRSKMTVDATNNTVNRPK